MMVWVIAILVIGIALAMLLVRNLLHTLFLLAGVLLGVAVLFASLQANFLAAAQIVLYIGGVLVLLLFGVMMAKRAPNGTPIVESYNRPLGFGIVLVFLGTIWVKGSALFLVKEPQAKLTLTMDQIGKELMGNWWLSLETAGLFLFIAILGSLWFAAKK